MQYIIRILHEQNKNIQTQNERRELLLKQIVESAVVSSSGSNNNKLTFKKACDAVMGKQIPQMKTENVDLLISDLQRLFEA